MLPEVPASFEVSAIFAPSIATADVGVAAEAEGFVSVTQAGGVDKDRLSNPMRSKLQRTHQSCCRCKQFMSDPTFQQSLVFLTTEDVKLLPSALPMSFSIRNSEGFSRQRQEQVVTRLAWREESKQQ